jgi:hypothetical protein
MTWLSWFFALYPALVLGLAATALAVAVATGCPLWLLGIPGALYLFPLVTYRLHDVVFPLREGMSFLLGDEYSPWWGGHQIQWHFVAFPFLEAALRAVPGLYSAWLRAWGSEVGSGVYWTPTLEVADRALLRIGDNVVFGQACGLYAHLITPSEDDLKLLVRAIQVGSGSFVGAGSFLAAGVKVGPGVTLPMGSRLRPGERREA